MCAVSVTASSTLKVSGRGGGRPRTARCRRRRPAFSDSVAAAIGMLRDQVAGLADEPGQALALGRRRRSRAGRSPTSRSPTATSPPASRPTTKTARLLVGLERAGQVGGARDRHARGRAGRASSRRPPSSPAARRSGTRTPWPPNAAAERTTAPRLRGSVTPSSATSSGGSPRRRARRASRRGGRTRTAAPAGRGPGGSRRRSAGRARARCLEHRDAAVAGELAAPRAPARRCRCRWRRTAPSPGRCARSASTTGLRPTTVSGAPSRAARARLDARPTAADGARRRLRSARFAGSGLRLAAGCWSRSVGLGRRALALQAACAAGRRCRRCAPFFDPGCASRPRRGAVASHQCSSSECPARAVGGVLDDDARRGRAGRGSRRRRRSPCARARLARSSQRRPRRVRRPRGSSSPPAARRRPGRVERVEAEHAEHRPHRGQVGRAASSVVAASAVLPCAHDVVQHGERRGHAEVVVHRRGERRRRRTPRPRRRRRARSPARRNPRCAGTRPPPRQRLVAELDDRPVVRGDQVVAQLDRPHPLHDLGDEQGVAQRLAHLLAGRALTQPVVHPVPGERRRRRPSTARSRSRGAGRAGRARRRGCRTRLRGTCPPSPSTRCASPAGPRPTASARRPGSPGLCALPEGEVARVALAARSASAAGCISSSRWPDSAP